MHTPALLRALALGLPLVLAACGGNPEKSAPADATPTPTPPGVRYHDDGLGISFEHSPEFEAVRFVPPEIPEEAAEALKAAGIDRTRQVGLVEKRLLAAYDLDLGAVPLGEVSAILLEYHPAVPVTATGEAGWLESCAASVPVQHLGCCDAYELPGYPGPYGEAAFCWLVRLPYGWLLVSAPRVFETDGTPTSYNLEIRRILETLTTDASAPSA